MLHLILTYDLLPTSASSLDIWQDGASRSHAARLIHCRSQERRMRLLCSRTVLLVGLEAFALAGELFPQPRLAPS